MNSAEHSSEEEWTEHQGASAIEAEDTDSMTAQLTARVAELEQQLEVQRASAKAQLAAQAALLHSWQDHTTSALGDLQYSGLLVQKLLHDITGAGRDVAVMSRGESLIQELSETFNASKGSPTGREDAALGQVLDSLSIHMREGASSQQSVQRKLHDTRTRLQDLQHSVQEAVSKLVGAREHSEKHQEASALQAERSKEQLAKQVTMLLGDNRSLQRRLHSAQTDMEVKNQAVQETLELQQLLSNVLQQRDALEQEMAVLKAATAGTGGRRKPQRREDAAASGGDSDASQLDDEDIDDGTLSELSPLGNGDVCGGSWRGGSDAGGTGTTPRHEYTNPMFEHLASDISVTVPRSATAAAAASELRLTARRSHSRLADEGLLLRDVAGEMQLQLADASELDGRQSSGGGNGGAEINEMLTTALQLQLAQTQQHMLELQMKQQKQQQQQQPDQQQAASSEASRLSENALLRYSSLGLPDLSGLGGHQYTNSLDSVLAVLGSVSRAIQEQDLVNKLREGLSAMGTDALRDTVTMMQHRSQSIVRIVSVINQGRQLLTDEIESRDGTGSPRPGDSGGGSGSVAFIDNGQRSKPPTVRVGAAAERSDNGQATQQQQQAVPPLSPPPSAQEVQNARIAKAAALIQARAEKSLGLMRADSGSVTTVNPSELWGFGDEEEENVVTVEPSVEQEAAAGRTEPLQQQVAELQQALAGAHEQVTVANQQVAELLQALAGAKEQLAVANEQVAVTQEQVAAQQLQIRKLKYQKVTHSYAPRGGSNSSTRSGSAVMSRQLSTHDIGTPQDIALQAIPAAMAAAAGAASNSPFAQLLPAILDALPVADSDDEDELPMQDPIQLQQSVIEVLQQQVQSAQQALLEQNDEMAAIHQQLSRYASSTMDAAVAAALQPSSPTVASIEAHDDDALGATDGGAAAAAAAVVNAPSAASISEHLQVMIADNAVLRQEMRGHEERVQQLVLELQQKHMEVQGLQLEVQSKAVQMELLEQKLCTAEGALQATSAVLDRQVQTGQDASLAVADGGLEVQAGDGSRRVSGPRAGSSSSGGGHVLERISMFERRSVDDHQQQLLQPGSPKRQSRTSYAGGDASSDAAATAATAQPPARALPHALSEAEMAANVLWVVPKAGAEHTAGIGEQSLQQLAEMDLAALQAELRPLRVPSTTPASAVPAAAANAAALEEEVVQLRGSLRAAHEENVALRADLEALADTVAVLEESAVSKAEHAPTAAAPAEPRQASSTETQSSSDAASSSSSSSSSNGHVDVIGARKAQREHERLSQAVAMLTEQLQVKEEERARLAATIAELSSAAEAQQEASELQLTQSTLRQEMLQEQLQHALSDADATQAQLAAAEAVARTAAELQQQQQQQQMQQRQDDSRSVVDPMTPLRNEGSVGEGEGGARQQSLIKARLSAAHAQIAQLQLSIATQLREKQGAVQQVAGLQAEMGAMQLMAQQGARLCTELEAAVSRLEDEVAMLSQQLQHSQGELARSQEYVTQLQRRVDQLTGGRAGFGSSTGDVDYSHQQGQQGQQQGLQSQPVPTRAVEELQAMIGDLQHDADCRERVILQLQSRLDVRSDASYVKTQQLRKLHADIASRDRYIGQLEGKLRLLNKGTRQSGGSLPVSRILSRSGSSPLAKQLPMPTNMNGRRYPGGGDGGGAVHIASGDGQPNGPRLTAAQLQLQAAAAARKAAEREADAGMCIVQVASPLPAISKGGAHYSKAAYRSIDAEIDFAAMMDSCVAVAHVRRANEADDRRQHEQLPSRRQDCTVSVPHHATSSPASSGEPLDSLAYVYDAGRDSAATAAATAAAAARGAAAHATAAGADSNVEHSPSYSDLIRSTAVAQFTPPRFGSPTSPTRSGSPSRSLLGCWTNPDVDFRRQAFVGSGIGPAVSTWPLASKLMREAGSQ